MGFHVCLAFAYQTFAVWAVWASESTEAPICDAPALVQTVTSVGERTVSERPAAVQHAPQWDPEIAHVVNMADGLRVASSRNRGMFAYLGDNASVQLMKIAEDLGDELLHAARLAQQSASDPQGVTESSRLLRDILQLVKPEREHPDAAEQYLPIMNFIDARFSQTMQTCNGAALDKPIFGVSRDGCATACDAKTDSCVGFSYYDDDDRSLCFLFATLSSVTYYPECKAAPSSLIQTRSQFTWELGGLANSPTSLQQGERMSSKVQVSKWKCDTKTAVPFQSTTRDGITKIESLDIGTGEYKLVMEIPRSRTSPPFRNINSCAINPLDGILHCSMEINNRGSFLVRIDETQVAFVTKLPGWRYSATFDALGNYYISGSSGLSVIAKVTDMPSYDNLHDIDPHNQFTHPKDLAVGADVVPLTKDLEGIGVHTYLLSLRDTDLKVVRVTTTPWKVWTIPCEGKNFQPRSYTWGSAWSFGGRYYFAPDTGEGVHELDLGSIDLVDGTAATLYWVSRAQKTGWNDGFNCFGGHDPFDPDHVKEWDCSNQPRALQVTTTHLSVPTTPKSKSYIEYLNIEEGKYEILFEVQKYWTDPPFNCINSCAINPMDNVIHCTMEIDNRGSFLMRIDDTKVGYVAKVPGWQYAGIFDSKGNYYMYGSRGVSVVENVIQWPTKKSYNELGSESQYYRGPHRVRMGADLVVFESDLVTKGVQETYLLAVESGHLHILSVSAAPYKHWKLWGNGLPETEESLVWGSAWNFDGGMFFAPDSAEGVFQLLPHTINLEEGVAKFIKVGKSQKTEWNDGFSCSKGISPFTFSLLQEPKPQTEATTEPASADLSLVGLHKATQHVQCMARQNKIRIDPQLFNVSRADVCL